MLRGILIIFLSGIYYFLIGNATIIFEQEDLSVVWESDGEETKRLFSYCINREDVENAILQGP